MKSQLKAGAVLSYLALFISSAISIIYTPVMLKLLGQSEYGLFSLATAAVSYVGVLNFGLGNAVINYTAKYKVLKDKTSISNLYGLFCIMYGILGIIALILGMILTLNSHLIFSNSLNINEINQLKIIMGVTVINISLGIGFGFFSVISLAHEKFIFQKVLGIVSSIFSPLVMLPLLLMGYGSISMAIVTTILNFITILINIIYCFNVLKINITFKKIEISLLKEILGFSFFIFINLIIDKIYWSTDQIILGIYSGTVAVSIYTVGATFSGYFSGLSASISNVFLSKVSGMVAKEVSDKEISDLFIKIGRLQYIVISFALSGFIVFGQEFIFLWVGEDYIDSFIIAILILVPMIVPLIQGMGGLILQAKNMQKFKTVVYAVVAIANVLLSIIFVQWWGAIGTALATALAFTIGNIIIMNFYYWKKIRLDIPMFWKNIIMMSTPFAVSLIFGATINNIVPAENWILFLLKVFLFIIAYFGILWFAGMNKYEKNIFVLPFKNIIMSYKKGILHKVR
ncbi:oligosaccharide flippase family protein [Bacillus sp. J37]|uniref:oligosaccharide flippase family protein n=1 Tax=Bacillus sp. J37 TaxID=935837 RepID=UPI00047CC88E|nr:oligosaccharide flippase family protein [Bacillus sp. J37]